MVLLGSQHLPGGRQRDHSIWQVRKGSYHGILNRWGSTVDTLREKAKAGRQSATRQNKPRTAKASQGLEGGKQKMQRTHPADFVTLGKRNAVEDSSGHEGTSLRPTEKFRSHLPKMRQYTLTKVPNFSGLKSTKWLTQDFITLQNNVLKEPMNVVSSKRS